MKICIKCKSEFNGRRCLPCNRLRNRVRAKANPEKTKAYKAKYEALNREKLNAKRVLKYAENKANGIYRIQNPINNRYRVADYAAKNPDYYRIKRHLRRARKHLSGGTLSAGLTEKLLILQIGKCACCRATLTKTKFHLDHIMPLALSGSNTDDNIQLLCPACNQSKHSKHPIDFMQSRGFLL